MSKASYVVNMAEHPLAGMVERLSSEDLSDTPFEGLKLFRISHRIEPTHGTLEPSICGAVQGKKRVHLGGESYDYNATHYLCSTMPIPVEGEVIEASEERPLLGFTLAINTSLMKETVVEMEAEDSSKPSMEIAPGLTVAEWEPTVILALERVLELIDDSVAFKVLGKGRMKELMFALLRGGAGASIRRALGASRDVARAVSYLNEHLSENISIDALAKEAGMSRAVFHRKFKAATSYSPIQFIKATRLNRAAMLIASGSTAADAAYEVGYASQSQFSREFRRQFGRTPRQYGELAPIAATAVG